MGHSQLENEMDARDERAALESEVARLRDALEHDRTGIERDQLEAKLTALRMAAECLVEEIEHVVGTAAVADMMFAIEASR